jgi:hypothetical protein
VSESIVVFVIVVYVAWDDTTGFGANMDVASSRTFAAGACEEQERVASYEQERAPPRRAPDGPARRVRGLGSG